MELPFLPRDPYGKGCTFFKTTLHGTQTPNPDFRILHPSSAEPVHPTEPGPYKPYPIKVLV